METSQLATFLWLSLTGIALSFLFDCYRLMRGTLKPRGFITSLTDLVFWLLSTLVVFAVLLRNNWGEMRLYVFVSLILGVLVYYRILSSRAMKLILLGLNTCRGMIQAIFHTFQIIIVQPFFYTLRVVTYPLRFLGRRTQFIYRGMNVKARQVWNKLELFFK